MLSRTPSPCRGASSPDTSSAHRTIIPCPHSHSPSHSRGHDAAPVAPEQARLVCSGRAASDLRLMSLSWRALARAVCLSLSRPGRGCTPDRARAGTPSPPCTPAPGARLAPVLLPSALLFPASCAGGDTFAGRDTPPEASPSASEAEAGAAAASGGYNVEYLRGGRRNPCEAQGAGQR